MAKIKIRQKRSLIAQNKKNVRVVKSLGLGKIGSCRTYKDNNCIRGMINKVKHLLEYELISE